MRAKMKVMSVHVFEGREDLSLSAVCKSGGYPADGTDEDNTYAKFTPSATLTMSVTNPILFGTMTPGQKYYVDFTLAE